MTIDITEGGKTRRPFVTIVAVIGALIAVAGLYYFLFYDKPSDSPADQQTGTSLKAVKLEKLTPQNSDYKLSVASSTAGDVLKITNFEDDSEKWQGGGVYDSQIYYEGSNSLSLVSVDGKETISYLKKSIDLSKMEYLEFMLNVSDVTALETLKVEFGDLDMKNYYQYTLGNVNTGWNLIQIPQKQFVSYIDAKSDFGWNKAQKIQFRLVSRLDGILIARMDMMHVINNSYNFSKEWKVYSDYNKMFLSLYQGNNNNNKLVVRNQRAVAAVLDTAKNMNDFIFSASVSPQTGGRSGLFARGNYTNGYGYYFFIGGDRSNTWSINKLNNKGWLPAEQVIKGDIGNDVFQNNKEYWLRVEARGNELEFFLSFDNNTYYRLGGIKDVEFRSGGVGVAAIDGTYSLFDNFLVKKL